MTPKGFFLVFTGLVILTVSIILQKWFVSFLSIPLFLPVLLAIYQTPIDPSLLRVRREITPSTTFVGDTIRVKIAVKNLSGRDVLLELKEKLPNNLKVDEKLPHVLIALKPHQEFAFVYALSSDLRGHFPVGPLEVWQLDPFLVTRRKVLEVPPEAVGFLPRIHRVSYLKMPYARTTHMAGEVPSNTPGEGFEFQEVAEVHELTGKRINWKAVAKSRRPFVNTYRVEKSLECLVVLDVPSNRLLGKELTNIVVDKMVELTATLVNYLTKRGNRVSLLVTGSYRDWVRPGFGKRHMLRILHSLADVKCLEFKPLVDFSEVFQLTAPFLTKSGSLIFVVSAFTEPSGNGVFKEAVSRGYTVVPIAINPFRIVEKYCKGERKQVVSKLSEVWEKGIIGVIGSGRDLKIDFQLLRLVEAMLSAYA